MTFPPTILATDTDHAITKLIPFVIILIFWGMSAVASAVKKVQEENKRRQARAQLMSRSEVPPLPPSVRPMRPAPKPARRMAAKVPLSKLAPPRRAALQKLPAFPVPVAPPIRPAQRKKSTSARGSLSPMGSDAPVTTVLGNLTPAAASPTQRQAAPAANAASLARWLRPTTMRQQFILTEIFQPPLALRETESR